MVSRLITKYPIIKTMGAYFCINVAADFNEQILIKKRTKETYDRGKTARIAATCTFVTSPMMFVWIRFIDKFIPGRTAISVVKKVVADAFIFAPTVISTFYITTNILEGKQDLTAEWKKKFYPTWTTGLCYWPFVQAINFAVIPMKYKTCLYMPTASFIWMNYLCFMKDQKVVNTEDEENNTRVQGSTKELIPKTYLKSVTHVYEMPFEPQISPPQTDVHSEDSHTNCGKNYQSSQTIEDKESVLHSAQLSVLCSKCQTTQSAESAISQQSWPVLANSDLFTPFVILSSS